jgi:hypothetical protein
MALRKRNTGGIPPPYPNNYNRTAPNNPSHAVDDKTNFSLRPINYENIDEAVFKEFNQRFTISSKLIPLLPLDAEPAALYARSFKQFDTVKGFLNLPYFTFWRNETSPVYRTSPSHKPVIYSIPKMKPQGLVYEEWITPSPRLQKMNYVFKFYSTYRQSVNDFELQMNYYFKNKRNVIIVDNERFEIFPSVTGKLGELDIIGRDDIQKTNLYELTFELTVWAYIRRLEDIQKRERPNRINLKFVEKIGRTDKDLIVINESTIGLSS